MNNHEHFEELSALAAGGLLPGGEMREWLEHSATCSQCRADYRMFVDVHDEEIPLALKRTPAFPSLAAPPIPDGFRERFLARMWEVGARFSDEAAANRKLRWRGAVPAFTLPRVAVTAASILGLAILTAGSLYLSHRRGAADVQQALATQQKSSASTIQQLAKENGELPQTADPVVLAQLASATIHSIAVRARARVPRKELEAIVKGAVDVMVRG